MNTDEQNNSNTPDPRLVELRKTIDHIDEQILALINQRLESAKEIGDIKKQKGDRVVDSAREMEILNHLADINRGLLSKNALRQIFMQIIAASREIQKSHRVCYLGPEATYTHLASVKHFGKFVTFISQPSIKDVFKEVEKGACDYGVVPVENSIEGAVNHTLDLFFESNIKICGEVYQNISHDLLSNSGSLKDVQTIYSHPQAFAQCRKWIEKYIPHALLEECSSTAIAAKKASVTPRSAAIASEEAAHMYGLEVLGSRIEDAARNMTRFLVIGYDEIRPTGDDKTSLMFVLSHIPGALYKILQPIAEAGVNLLKLESRPAKHENWSYFFFADMEGHINDPKVKETVANMKRLCLYLKHLGSYPRIHEGVMELER